MRLLLFGVALLYCCTVFINAYEDATLEDDDFAEFEQFDAEDDLPLGDFNEEEKDIPKSKPNQANKEQFEINDEVEEDVLVEDEDNEFEHFQDPEEFEGFQETVPKQTEQPKITISKVPIMIRPHWDAYWLEGILCCALAVYAFVYMVGRSKNTSIALNFLKKHKPLLDDNFTLVGETGSDVVSLSPEERGWKREAEHCFTMWCSGRLCCEGMLLTLKLIKRQDLVNVLINLVRPSPDTLTIKVELSKEEGDPFVLCIAQKKVATKLVKELQDISAFCPEKRPGDKHGLPSSLCVMSECGEATGALLDGRVSLLLTNHASRILSLHVSDRYTTTLPDESAAPSTKPPDYERVIILNAAINPEEGEDEVRPLLQLTFYLMEKLKRLRLSKEALNKCEKRRQKMAEAWVRGAHAARQEQAAQKREEKRRAEKEKILAEDDPEKQRRWELKEQKRQQKRRTPKMKQLTVKAL